MLILAGALVGGSYGAWLAHRRKGTRADIAQYAAAFAIACAILGVFASVLLARVG